MYKKIPSIVQFSTKLATIYQSLWLSFTLILIVFSFLSSVIAAQQTPILTYYDEFTVWTISSQPLTQLFDTLISEPHPPGFYLLLKTLPFTSAAMVKISISLLSHGLLLVLLILNKQKKIFEHFSLNTGFLLLFSSIAFTQILNTVKQESLSVPLLLILCLYLLEKIKGVSKIRNDLIIFVLIFLLFNLGYITFLFGLVFTILCYIFHAHKRGINRQIFLPLAFLFTYLVGYFFLFGKSQFFANQNRFAWINSSSSGLISGISLFLTFQQPMNFITDVSVTVFIGLCVLSYWSIKTTRVTLHWYLFVIATALALLIGGYAFNLFVRTRYLIVFYGFLCVLAGWGILTLESYLKRQIAVFIVLTFFIFGRYLYLIHYQLTIANDRSIQMSIQKQLQAEPFVTFGLLSHTPSAQLSFKLKYFSDNDNLVPIHPLFPHIFSNQKTISKQHLQLDGYTQGFDKIELIEENLRSTGLKNFIYLMPIVDLDSYYDKNHIVLSVLANSCHTKMNSTVLYTFFRCWEN